MKRAFDDTTLLEYIDQTIDIATALEIEEQIAEESPLYSRITELRKLDTALGLQLGPKSPSMEDREVILANILQAVSKSRTNSQTNASKRSNYNFLPNKLQLDTALASVLMLIFLGSLLAENVIFVTISLVVLSAAVYTAFRLGQVFNVGSADKYSRR